jgi:hypothetical protein
MKKRDKVFKDFEEYQRKCFPKQWAKDHPMEAFRLSVIKTIRKVFRIKQKPTRARASTPYREAERIEDAPRPKVKRSRMMEVRGKALRIAMHLITAHAILYENIFNQDTKW